MSARPYPEGIDCVWLASDREGHVGAFITAGAGPIPTEALSSVSMPVEEIEGRLCRLPSVSPVRLFVSVKCPDGFTDLAKRGVFVYDWTDVGRTAREAQRIYERVAVPIEPIATSSLPSDLAALTKALRFADLVFAAIEAMDVCAHFSCVEAE